MNKEIREVVYNKFGGRCAYCGNHIEYKDMQVDHLVPIRRGVPDNRLYEERGKDEVSNYMPSCRMCNFYKQENSLEDFRLKIKQMLDYKHTFATRFALRYGILTEHEWDGNFYFEKL
jgi:5-methylcytosine-specific restriction endonuclease McrA